MGYQKVIDVVGGCTERGSFDHDTVKMLLLQEWSYEIMTLDFGSKIQKEKKRRKKPLPKLLHESLFLWVCSTSISKYPNPASIPRKYQPRMRIVGSNIGIELENSLKSLE